MLWEEKITEFLDEFNVTDVNREIISITHPHDPNLWVSSFIKLHTKKT